MIALMFRCLILVCYFIIETPLSCNDVEALRGVILENGFNPNEFIFGNSPCLLEPIQQLLIRKGKMELAENILEKVNEGMAICSH